MMNGICSKHIADTFPHTPMQLVYNVEYANQVQQQQQKQQERQKVNKNISKIDDNKNANNNIINDECDDEIAEDVERMDETDFAMKNILNSFQLNQKTNVFCCGENEQANSKVLLNRRSGPGQAVRTVITAECSTSSSIINTGVNKERLREAEELKPKKMKITAPQNV